MPLSAISVVARVSRRVLVVTAAYILGCIPAILLAERYGWTQTPFHLTQLIAVVLCLLSCIVFLATTRSSPFRLWQWLASVALVLLLLWLALVAYIILTYSGPEG